MKYLLVLSILFSSLSSQAFYYMEKDKNQHVAVAAGVTYLGTHVLKQTLDLTPTQAYLLSAGLVLTAGLFKETMMDDFADEGDIRANFAGVVTAFPLVVITF